MPAVGYETIAGRAISGETLAAAGARRAKQAEAATTAREAKATAGHAVSQKAARRKQAAGALKAGAKRPTKAKRG